jgi:N12 class adenine-specific DNA methylase
MNRETNRISKLIDVRRYYDDALKQISSSEEAWKAFLVSEGRFIHYPFDIQLMIHSQRPGATACAKYSEWNAINCVPRRGSKGIQYVDYSKGKPQLQYLFDIADVVSREQKPLPKLWEFPKVEKYISELTRDDTKNSIELKMWNYLETFIDRGETEKLLKNFNINDTEKLSTEIDKLQKFFHASVSYAVFARCGLDLGVCDELNKPLLKNNSYSIQNLDRNGLYVVNDGIMNFSKPVYQEIREQVKLFERHQTNVQVEAIPPISVQASGDEKLEETVYSTDAKPYGQLKLPIFESEDINKNDQVIERITELIMENDFPGNWNNPIKAEQIPKPLLHAALKTGSNTQHSKFRIEKFYVGSSALEDAPSRAKAIKKEYGQSGCSFKPDDDYEGVYSSSTIGSKMELEWKSQGLCYRAKVEWNIVEKTIHSMISDNEYITAEERLEYRKEIAFRAAMNIAHGFIKIDGLGHLIEFERKGELWTNPYADIVLPETFVELSEDELERIAEISYTVDRLDGTKLYVNESKLKMMQEGLVIYSPDESGSLVQMYSADEFNPDLDLAEEVQPNTTLVFTIQQDNTLDKSDVEISKDELSIDIPLPGNYKIEDLQLNNNGGPKVKYKQNIEAIKVLKTIEADQRSATYEEQVDLAGFVGWGGLADVFDESKDAWANEYQDLHELLTQNEYLAARASTLNAHYTSPLIIQSIYQALENMGVKRGNILEPACGSGNFFGMLPASMSECQLYGVELDDLTGRIAKQLYPDVNISITGYEKTKYPNNFFDGVVGNVPFGDYKVSDRIYDKYNFSIHDYFIAKGLDQLRPGGVMAVITSSWTMDKKNSSARKYFAERANLIGAIRLPDNAFKANAGTEAVTDILFFQKLDNVPDPNPIWLYVDQNISDKDPVRVGDIVTTSQYDYATYRQKVFDAQVIEIQQMDNKVFYYLQALDDSQTELRQNAENVTLKEREGMVYSCNRYFIENPHMVMGEFKFVSGPFGERLTCKATDSDLNDKLRDVVNKYIHCEFTNNVKSDTKAEKTNIISADLHVRNYTYALVDDDIYYRTDSVMVLVQISSKDLPRIKAMIELRDLGYELLDAELNNDLDYSIDAKMSKLNEAYDAFVEHFGVIHSKENKKLFSKDVTYSFLCSFEIMDDNNDVSGKAALFSKRVINPKTEITHVDTANEALMMSLSEKGYIVLDYMAGLVGKEKGELISDLRGVIFKDPDKTGDDKYSGYVTADEYLSGNVKHKMERAIQCAELDSQYDVNVQYLQQVQPEPLEASEIDVRLGATWIEPEYIEQYLKETFQLPDWRFTDTANKSERLTVSFEKLNGEWNISNKVVGDSILLATTKYGTPRKNSFHILENCLNLRDSKVYDQKWNSEKQRYDSILNKEETATCNQKAEALKAEFENWIFAEPERRNYLVHKYNNLYNNNRPRQYDGSHLIFPGMNPEIKLMSHQKNAVARTLYGGNTLLAHVVGAGKTYEITASVMEQKRISLCNKAMIVVPNHLTEQWGREFTDLYPSANILVAKKDDFIPARRREFCSKIATGEYDAVIIGHTQFEKIPLSVERLRYYIDRQIKTIERAIEEQKEESGQSFTVKQLEKTEKRLQAKLEKLINEGKRDNVVTFEQLGIDRLYVDESHSYKNLYLYTKMSNVAGIQQTEAQKSTDMYMKCQYMNEMTQGKCGIVFASGTPISNSMTELYTNMRYLQSDLLERYGLENFDAWASTFGNIQTAIELSPEGTNYRAKKRFSSFFNIPELMNLWKEAADVQTADMLNLAVPTATYVNVKLPPTKLQEKMVESLAERADEVRNGDVDPSVDNMLKITNDGRKLALDQRLINPNMPDVPVSKVNVCAQKAYEIWEQTKVQRSAQIIFCDLSTPKQDGSFSVYDSIKKKLVELGVPVEEIAFIHDAKTDIQKDKLFKQVRSGEKRFLLGSTFMMGAGTNVQRNLIAEHHLDVPWRPSDIEQREGRIIRQGNENDHVWIFRYITSGTFDAYSWQVIENKQKFISQIMTSKSPVRSCADLDEQSLSYAEVKALATGNPYIKEKMELDISVSQLNRELANHKSNIYRYQDDYTIKYPQEISRLKNLISGITKDIELYKSSEPANDEFTMIIGDKTFTDRTEAGEALKVAVNEACALQNTDHQLGTYLGFKIAARKGDFAIVPQVIIGGEINYIFDLSMNAVSNISSITRTFHSLDERVKSNKEKLSAAQSQLEIAKIESEKPFPKEELYKSQIERLSELNALLGISEKDQNETGAIDDSSTIQIETVIGESSWWKFVAYNPDSHPEEYDLVPDMDTVEYLVMKGDNNNMDIIGERPVKPVPSVLDSRDDLYPAKDKLYFDQLPIDAVATLDFVRNPNREGTAGSIMFKSLLILTEESNHKELYSHYDNAWLAANIKDNFQSKIAILQLREGEQNHNRRFASTKILRSALQEAPNCDNYELIYVRNAEQRMGGPVDQAELCNSLYEEFNADTLRPANYYGHSLSVGDVIVIANDFGDSKAFFVDDNGFMDLSDRFLSPEMNAKIRNDLDIRQESRLHENIRNVDIRISDIDEDAISIESATEYDRQNQISENYEHIFEMADRRKFLIESAKTEYNLVFGSVGNGITVWNQNEPIYSRPEDEVHMVSDYRTLAYISPDGVKVTWYADNLPDVVISSIEVAAEEQREKYNPDILNVRGFDVEMNLSALPNDALSEFLKDKEVTYIVESVEHYKDGQIDSGDKSILSTKEFMEPLKAFGDKDNGEHNLYACIVENENRLIYVINEKQLEHEAKRYLLQLQESETNPVVRIDFSESGMFHDSEYMSFIDADNRFAGYNKAATEMDILGGYKTYFSICGLKENKVHIYDGRYDIGSDSDSLLEHIQDLAQYQTSETYKAMMKTQCNQEEYKQWKIEQDKFIGEWIPGLQSTVSKQIDRETNVAKYQQEYKKIYMGDKKTNNNIIDAPNMEEIIEGQTLIGPLSLDDNLYTFYQDGKPIRTNETFKQAVLGLLTSKGCGNGKEYLLTMKVLDQEIPILRGANVKLEIPVPEINKIIDISKNSDMKNILGHMITTVKPNVIDPYNDMNLSFEEYAAHEGNNIWRNPAVAYRASDIFVSVYEETALNELNKQFKCYLKPQDILAISEQKCLGSKPVTLSKEVETSIETVKSLVETYVTEKPESPQPESVLQPE